MAQHGSSDPGLIPVPSPGHPGLTEAPGHLQLPVPQHNSLLIPTR